jgi:hypothetical protein
MSAGVENWKNMSILLKMLISKPLVYQSLPYPLGQDLPFSQ